MKRIWTIFLLVSSVSGADVTLSMTGQTIDNAVRWAAIDQVVKMFGAIGVRVDSKKARAAALEGVAIEVRFTTGIEGRPGAMAFSTPFDPHPVVTILYDRILFATERRPEFRARFLAHVLVHEIGHVLLRSTSHSSEGIMKAHWGGADYWQIGRRLAFARDDADRIRSTIAGRQRQTGSVFIEGSEPRH